MSKEIEIMRANALGYGINYFTKLVYICCIILFLWFYLIPALNSREIYVKSEIDQLSRQKTYHQNKINIIKNANIYNLLTKYQHFDGLVYDNLYTHRLLLINSITALNAQYDLIGPIRVNYAGVTASQRKMSQGEYFIYDMKTSFKAKSMIDAVSIAKRIDSMLPKYSNIHQLSMHRCQFESIWTPDVEDNCISANINIVFRYFTPDSY